MGKDMDVKNITNMMSSKTRIRVPVVLIVSFVLVLAISGLNPIKKKVVPLVPLDEFTSHLDKQIPFLMDHYEVARGRFVCHILGKTMVKL